MSELMQQNVDNLQQALNREKEFLAYASHELRTPITVLLSDSDLLDKICKPKSDKEEEIRKRITDSGLNMKAITETLLWLSRDSLDDIPIRNIDISLLLQQVVSDQAYLIKDRNIDVILTTSSYDILVAESPVYILLNNAIRNAYQHSSKGPIEITQKGSEIRITNPIPEEDSQLNTGFGMGLLLIGKIAQHFGWQFTELRTGELNEVLIKLNPSDL